MNMNFLHLPRSNLSARLEQGDIEAFDYLSSRITPKNSDDGILWMQKCFAKCGIAYREIKERPIQQRKKKKKTNERKSASEIYDAFCLPFSRLGPKDTREETRGIGEKSASYVKNHRRTCSCAINLGAEQIIVSAR